MSRKLTVGMCCYDDLEGVVWTIETICMYHREALDEIEFLILDNNPDSPHGKALEQFVKWIQQPIRLEQIREKAGTALRTRIFDLATTPYVICLDCHVMLEAGSLRKLIDGFDAGFDRGHLLQGPMLADNMRVMATHMSEVWRSGMLGIWAIAWRCTCGAVYQSAKREEGEGVNWLEIQSLQPPHQTLTGCPGCGFEFPAGIRWEGHENALEASGMQTAAQGEPFEIPAHGLGLFACRKDAWLGFHPGFREFGGEECYIHEKFRQAGKTTICLPFLKWWHRFWRISGQPYSAPFESRIMNYLLGHVELGLDPQPALEHFAALMPDRDLKTHWVDGHPKQVALPLKA